MFQKVAEIAEAWIIATNPTDEQLKLADDRYEICKTCPNLRKVLARTKLEYLQCGKCGCPISKKIFSNSYGACPAGKWIDVENQYFNLKTKAEDNKTIL
jgi:hypothetical protein